MSRLKELINLLCSKGVRFCRLSDVATVSIGEFVHKSLQNDADPYPVYNGGISNTGFYKEYNRTENKIIISARGANAGFVNKVLTKFWSGNSCYTIDVKDKRVNWIYLYYWLKNNELKLLGVQQKAGIPAVSKRQVEEFPVPVPPITVQEEIVSILDNLTEKVEELQESLHEEIYARKEQYEYCRNKLLTFNDGVLNKSLSEVAKLITGATPNTSKTEFWENGTIPWMSSGEVNLKKVYSTEKAITQIGYDNTSTTLVPPHTVVIALAGQGKTRGKVAITEIELCTNQSLCSILCDNQIDYRFLYFYLDSKYENLRSISNGAGARGGLSLQLLKPYQIPVPPLEVQEKIVETLEKLESLYSDAINKILLEIQTRQKQYEYYRNKLLTFKERTN